MFVESKITEQVPHTKKLALMNTVWISVTAPHNDATSHGKLLHKNIQNAALIQKHNLTYLSVICPFTWLVLGLQEKNVSHNTLWVLR